MNSIMNGNQLTIVKKHEINKRLIHKTDSITDDCYRDCHSKNFRTFK